MTEFQLKVNPVPEIFVPPESSQPLSDIQIRLEVGDAWSYTLPTPSRDGQYYESVDLSAVISFVDYDKENEILSIKAGATDQSQAG